MDCLHAKSVLMLGGCVKVPEGFSHPYADEAGDGTGTFMLAFGCTRIYKRYSASEGEFELCSDGRGYSLTHNGKPFIDRVELVKRYSHAPGQANINIGKFDSDEDMLAALDALIDTGTVQGISVSTGPDSTVEDCVRTIAKIRYRCPDIPIGLSYRICSKTDLERIKAAGVDEYKLNIGSTVPRIFEALNPGGDLSGFMDCYRDAVSVFGRGSVSNSLYAGLGETDAEMERSIRDLASIGVLSDVKVKRITDANRSELESILGPIPELTSERLASFGSMLKRIEGEYDLDPTAYRTLCNACRGCNLVPFLDYR